MSAQASSPPRPLDGVRVLDMTRLLPGPFCTQLLCDLGAEVIKVEDPGGDYARFYPPLLSDGNSAIFHALNRGKKSVSLDLKNPADRSTLLSLISTADVLVESFRPGVMEKLGLSPTQLQSKHPSLIMCSISGYGQTGPMRLRAGHDVNYMAVSGALGVMESPALLPVQVADIAGGSYPAALNILAALRQKQKTGKGAIIDVSMTDNVYSMLTMPLARYDISKESFSKGHDWLTGGTPCYGVYRTSDGWLSVGALEPKFWTSFCRALKLDHLIHKQFPDTAEEVRRVRQEVQDVLQRRCNEEWRKFWTDKDCCVEVVELPEEVSTRSPQLSQRGLDLTIRFPSSSSSTGTSSEQLRAPKPPLSIQGLQPHTTPGPALGQHNDEILKPIRAKL